MKSPKFLKSGMFQTGIYLLLFNYVQHCQWFSTFSAYNPSLVLLISKMCERDCISQIVYSNTNLLQFSVIVGRNFPF